MSMSNSLRYELNTGGSKRFKEARLRQQERIEVRININKTKAKIGGGLCPFTGAINDLYLYTVDININKVYN